MNSVHIETQITHNTHINITWSYGLYIYNLMNTGSAHITIPLSTKITFHMYIMLRERDGYEDYAGSLSYES